MSGAPERWSLHCDLSSGQRVTFNFPTHNAAHESETNILDCAIGIGGGLLEIYEFQGTSDPNNLGNRLGTIRSDAVVATHVIRTS